MAELIAQRKTRQPANHRSCGSVFRNPPGGPAAGWLIEAAGFKGHRLGDALVSRKHANFILNAGSATAAQVKALMEGIQKKVWQTQGCSWSGKWSCCRGFSLSGIGAVPSPPSVPDRGPDYQAETIGRRMVQVVPRSTSLSMVISP